MPRLKPFHVYSEDGFEDAYASERTARTHAKKGSKLRKMQYKVIETDSSGFTGNGRGRVVAKFDRGQEI
jgi:hypothetical protein